VPAENASSADLIRPPARSFFGKALARLRSTGTIVAVFLVSLIFVLGLVTLLDYLKFQSSINDLAERRIGIIIDRVHHSLETAIDLGLNLRDLGVARTILGNTQAEDPRIKSITIFSLEDGRILFSSDAATVGAAVDQSWLGVQAAAADRVWRIKHDDRILVGQRLDSALAAAVGGLVLEYSLADVIARTAAMRDHLLSAALLTLLAFSVVAVIGAIVVTREFRGTLGGLTEAIGAAVVPHSGSGPIPASLFSSVDHFRRTTSEAQSQLDRLENALDASPDADLRVEARAEGAAR
jgi:hypothetical protein